MAINSKISDNAILDYLRLVNNGATSSTWPFGIGNKDVNVYQNGNYQGHYSSDISIEYNYGTGHYSIILGEGILRDFLHQGYFCSTQYEILFDTSKGILGIMFGNKKIEILS